METSASASVLDWNRMKDEPRLCLKKMIGSVQMASNDRYLLYFPQNRVSIINENGEEQRTINCNFYPRDVCWSSYLNRFLILTYDEIHLLDVKGSGQLPAYEFTRGMQSCTCYDQTLLLVPSIGSFLEEYNLSSWKLIRTHKPPVSCSKHQDIQLIRFNSTGTHLGLLIRGKNDDSHEQYFVLHNWNDKMKLVHCSINLTDLSAILYPKLLPLSNQQFAIYSNNNLNLHLIDDSTGILT
jgi:hypothetical protein